VCQCICMPTWHRVLNFFTGTKSARGADDTEELDRAHMSVDKDMGGTEGDIPVEDVPLFHLDVTLARQQSMAYNRIGFGGTGKAYISFLCMDIHSSLA
jgi:hypothetical protein